MLLTHGAERGATGSTDDEVLLLEADCMVALDIEYGFIVRVERVLLLLAKLRLRGREYLWAEFIGEEKEDETEKPASEAKGKADEPLIPSEALG